MNITRSLLRYLFILMFAVLHGTLSGQSGLDSGGGRTTVGTYQNHASIGAPFETRPAMAGSYGIFLGLIEVLYPPLSIDPDVDSDGNGLPDWWELEHFGHIGVDPDDDADADGTTNLMEYLAQTDPHDPASVFRPAVYKDGDSLILPVQTQSERQYKIWGSPNLKDWALLDTLTGDGTLVEWSYSLSDPADLPYFLRIEVVLP